MLKLKLKCVITWIVSVYCTEDTTSCLWEETEKSLFLSAADIACRGLWIWTWHCLRAQSRHWHCSTAAERTQHKVKTNVQGMKTTMEREEGKKCEKWNCGRSGPTIIHITQHVVSSVVTGASRSCSAEACIMWECVFVHMCVRVCVCVEQCSRDVGGRWGYWAEAGHRADQSRAITVEREVGGGVCVCVCVLGGWWMQNAELTVLTPFYTC